MNLNVLRSSTRAHHATAESLPYHQPPANRAHKKWLRSLSPAGMTIAVVLLACVAVGAMVSAHYILRSGPDSFANKRLRTDSDPPTQIHINQGDAAGFSMVVSWVTENVECGEVNYHAVGSSLSFTASQLPPKRYTYKYVLQTGSYTSGIIHHVLIQNLTAQTVYEYTCGCADGGYSSAYRFMPWGSYTPTTTTTTNNNNNNNNALTDRPPSSFVIIGDLGQTNNSEATMAHAVQAGYNYSHVLIVGDLSYADSAGDPDGRNCTQKRWDSWAEKIQTLATTRPLMVLPGNHEIEWIVGMEGQQPFMAFDHRFLLPYGSDRQPSDRFYSFNTPWAHVVMLNSFDGEMFMGPYGPTSRQYQWLEADLRSIDREATPWVIACMHAPWYNSNTNHHNEEQEVMMREAMESLLHGAGVDIVFAGHVHAYERSFPVYQNITTPGAPTYITIGDGGNREGHAQGWYVPVDWSAHRDDTTFGHGLLTFVNASHALWTYHSIQNPEPVVLDPVWFVHNSYLSSSPVDVGVSTVDMQGNILHRRPSPADTQ